VRNTFIIREHSDRVATQEEVRFASHMGAAPAESGTVVMDAPRTSEFTRELLSALSEDELRLVAEILTLSGELVN
jgi:hypothetical protein